MVKYWVKARIEEGLIDSERTAYVMTSGGVVEEVMTHHRQTREDALEVGYITRRADDVLVEFPREATSGKWRAWVPRADVTEEQVGKREQDIELRFFCEPDKQGYRRMVVTTRDGERAVCICLGGSEDTERLITGLRAAVDAGRCIGKPEVFSRTLLNLFEVAMVPLPAIPGMEDV